MQQDMNEGKFVHPEVIQRTRTSLVTDACLLVPQAYSQAFCSTIRNWIDAYDNTDNTESNYAGSELRIWHAEEKNAAISTFKMHCDQFISALLGKEQRAANVLAIRNKNIDAKDTAVTMGRWHIDSFFNQVKVFLFLVDVNESTGPFEYIPGTHRPLFRARMAVNGTYFSLRDFKAGTRRYAKLNDTWIEKLAKRGYSSKPVICSAGTVMIVNTCAVHRARPCHEGARYALTAYYK